MIHGPTRAGRIRVRPAHNRDDWKEAGKRDAYELALEKAAKILSEHYPVYIDPAADAKIRERFPIMLRTQRHEIRQRPLVARSGHPAWLATYLSAQLLRTGELIRLVSWPDGSSHRIQ
jgi:hypothetical protein